MNGIACAFTARVGTEPERRATRNGSPMLTFRAVVDESTTRATEADPSPQWVGITAFGALADELAPRLKKGAPVYVEGRLKVAEWFTAEGEPRHGLSVAAWRIDLHAAIGKNAPPRQRPDEAPPVELPF